MLNPIRRQIIDDFRELLFMYINTQTPKEKAFFKASVLRQIKEIPGFQVVIVPSNYIDGFLDAKGSGQTGMATPRISQVLDKSHCLISGITIQP